jgi:mono/diheme cytochrome c family protein
MKTVRYLAAAAGLIALAAAGQALAQAGQGPPLVAQQRTQYPDLQTGEAIYKNICQGCHMPDGKGAKGAGEYPALAGNPKLGAAAYPVMVVVRGQKAMPEFGSAFTDAQVAEVVNYIRGNLGNTFKDKVGPEMVGPLRPAR